MKWQTEHWSKMHAAIYNVSIFRHKDGDLDNPEASMEETFIVYTMHDCTEPYKESDKIHEERAVLSVQEVATIRGQEGRGGVWQAKMEGSSHAPFPVIFVQLALFMSMEKSNFVQPICAFLFLVSSW